MEQKHRINRFGIALTDAALDGSVSKVQALLQQSSDYAYIHDVEYTTALHEVTKRIMENFIVNDPSRYTFTVLNKIKDYFRVARILRDHVQIKHERRCATPVSHIILNERPRWVLSEQVTITLLQSIATAQNMNYLLYTKEELIDRLCYEFVSHSLTPDNINLVDREGNTALHLAIKIQQWTLVDHLLDRGVDKDRVNKNGFAGVTLMHFPRSQDPTNTAILQRLVSPQTVNIRGLMGNTLLHRATFTHSYDKITLLLKTGAKLNVKNERGCIPLLVAILDSGQNAREANFFKVDVIPSLVPKGGSRLVLYDCINRLFDSARNTRENAEISRVLIDHLDPSVSMTLKYGRAKLGGPTKMSLFDGSQQDTISIGTFSAVLGMTAIVMDTCKWMPKIPCLEDLEQAVHTEDHASSLLTLWETYHQERMSLRRMSNMEIYSALWRANGDADQLPLPPKLIQPFKNFARNVQTKAFQLSLC